MFKTNDTFIWLANSLPNFYLPLLQEYSRQKAALMSDFVNLYTIHPPLDVQK